jgi:hypothetical protein
VISAVFIAEEAEEKDNGQQIPTVDVLTLLGAVRRRQGPTDTDS